METVRLETLTRRKELLKNRNLGMNLADNVNLLAAKYDVTKRAVYKDFKNRKAWIPVILQIEDTDTVFLDLLSQHKELYRLCSLEYLKADNSNAKIGALRLLRDLNARAQYRLRRYLEPMLRELAS